EVAIHALGQIRDYMDVKVVDDFADIFPALAPVEAARDAAVFDAEINDDRIIGMDKNIAHVAEMRRLRKPPVLAHFVGEFFKRGELFPMISAVFAAKKPDGFNAGVDDLVVRRIDGDGANVAVQHLHPALPAVARSIQSVVGHADENPLGCLLAAEDGIDDAVFEMSGNLFPSAVLRAPDQQSMLGTGV